MIITIFGIGLIIIVAVAAIIIMQDGEVSAVNLGSNDDKK